MNINDLEELMEILNALEEFSNRTSGISICLLTDGYGRVKLHGISDLLLIRENGAWKITTVEEKEK